ncbi:MAG: imidazole glycerol phosphate synthase subunit HisH [Desulfobacterales bacterium]
MITLLDYGAGNVRSVVNAIESLGETVKIVSTGDDILAAEKVVFPGVGAFGNMMQILHRKDLVEPLKAYLTSNRPFLGICLGLQALFDKSEEAPGCEGLGIIPGVVKRFTLELAVPHIGWNGISIRKPSKIFDQLEGSEKFYFVHSYYVAPLDASAVLTTTDYGDRFVSGIQRGNIIATQFHPEKSGRAGLRLLKNFVESGSRPFLSARTLNSTCLAKRIIACLDVRSNDQGDLVVTKGDRYDVREEGAVRNLGRPVELAGRYYEEGADEITFLNITGFRDFPLEDMPMLEVLKQTSRTVFVPLTRSRFSTSPVSGIFRWKTCRCSRC